jgi:hypothetical protein
VLKNENRIKNKHKAKEKKNTLFTKWNGSNETETSQLKFGQEICNILGIRGN